MSQLALVYQSMFRIDDAEPLARRALKASRRAVGDHVETVRCLSLLGMILGTRRQLQEAEPFVVEALEMARNAPAEARADTQVVIKDLVSLYEDWGKPEQAAEYRALLEEAQGVIAKD